MRQRRACRGLVQRPVRHPPLILAPRYLNGIGQQVFAADVMVLARFGAAQPGKVAFGLIGASAVLGERN